VDTPDIALLNVKVERAEYWDGKESILAQAVSFISALASGKQMEFGDNQKLELK